MPCNLLHLFTFSVHNCALPLYVQGPCNCSQSNRQFEADSPRPGPGILDVFLPLLTDVATARSSLPVLVLVCSVVLQLLWGAEHGEKWEIADLQFFENNRKGRILFSVLGEADKKVRGWITYGRSAHYVSDP